MSSSPSQESVRPLPATSTGSPDASLRAALAEQGCLYLPGLVDPPELAQLACDVTENLVRWGLARTAGDGLEWTGRPFAEAYDRAELHDVPAFHELVARIERGEGPWQAIADRLLGCPARVRRAASLFAGLPDDPAHQLPPHQDGFRATDDGALNLRIWLPLFPIPYGDGGLGLIPGSHVGGYFPTRRLDGYRLRPERGDPGRGDRGSGQPVTGIDLGQAGVGPVRTAAMSVGDALVFSYRTVHCGLPCQSNAIRVSVALSVTAERPGLKKTFHPGEIPERARLVRAAAEARGMTREQATAALVDLNVGGLDATPENVSAALAGEHGQWRSGASA